MPTIFTANESLVMVEGEAIEGVQTIEYRQHQVRENVYALGLAERIGMVSGPLTVEGRLIVASTNPKLDTLKGEAPFQIIAQLKHGNTTMTVTFDECFMLEKSFNMEVSGHGESIYDFTATRVKEEVTAA